MAVAIIKHLFPPNLGRKKFLWMNSCSLSKHCSKCNASGDLDPVNVLVDENLQISM